jgi:hypothetical protein
VPFQSLAFTGTQNLTFIGTMTDEL